MSAGVSSTGDELSFSAEGWIDPACDEFEAAWRAGGQPAPRDYLGQIRCRAAMALALCRVDFFCGLLSALPLDSQVVSGGQTAAAMSERFPRSPSSTTLDGRICPRSPQRQQDVVKPSIDCINHRNSHEAATHP